MKRIVFTIFCCFVCQLSLLAQSDQASAAQSVQMEDIKGHIGFLASDAMRGRDTPSPELQIASEYLKAQLMLYGAKPAPGMEGYFQEVPMRTVKPADEATFKLDTAELQLQKDFILIDGADLSTETEYIFLNYGLAEDLAGTDIEGKVVLALAGDGETQNPQEWFALARQKRNRVAEAGGVALLELYTSRQIPWNILQNYFSSSNRVSLRSTAEKQAGQGLLHAWIQYSGERLKPQVDAKTGSAALTVKGFEVNNFTTRNVVAYIEGTDPELKKQVLVCSGHYDHVGVGRADATGDTIYNGSRDNAVGTVTVLAAAENIGKQPLKRSVMFVLFTGEEKGLLGSAWFVQNSPIPLNQIVYCFNSDNGGYNDTSLATIIGLERTTADQHIIEACKAFGLKAIEDPAKEQGLFDRSDNVNFAQMGIPAPTFSMGFKAFDEEIFKYYHQPGDDPDTLDYDYLLKFFRSYVYATRLIGNDKTIPFWVEGDKYYEAGVKLYKR